MSRDAPSATDPGLSRPLTPPERLRVHLASGAQKITIDQDFVRALLTYTRSKDELMQLGEEAAREILQKASIDLKERMEAALISAHLARVDAELRAETAESEVTGWNALVTTFILAVLIYSGGLFAVERFWAVAQWLVAP